MKSVSDQSKLPPLSRLSAPQTFPYSPRPPRSFVFFFTHCHFLLDLAEQRPGRLRRAVKDGARKIHGMKFASRRMEGVNETRLAKLARAYLITERFDRISSALVH